jgi:hypothetical protein
MTKSVDVFDFLLDVDVTSIFGNYDSSGTVLDIETRYIRCQIAVLDRRILPISPRFDGRTDQYGDLREIRRNNHLK